MQKLSLFNLIALIIIASMTLSACATASAETPATAAPTNPPAATNTPLPTDPPAPTATDLPPTTEPTAEPTTTKTLTLVTDPAQIMGYWHGTNLDSYYHMYNADGTCWWGIIRDTPAVNCTYYFDGTDLHLTITEYVKADLPQCKEAEAVYQVEVISSRKIRFINSNQDDCQLRVTMVAQPHEKNP